MSPGPSLHAPITTRTLMVQAVAALSPVLAGAVWRHGVPALWILAASLAAGALCEALCARRAIRDGSVFVAGAIFALLLPAGSPLWLAAAGSATAVLLGKHAFGGLGCNPFNPAAFARACWMALCPAAFFAPAWTLDGTTSATALAKEIGSAPATLAALAWGSHPGTLAESFPPAVILGGIALIALRTIDWRVPVCYLSSIVFCTLVLPAGDRVLGHAPWLAAVPLAQVLGGGSLFAAFFLLTDPVTAPISKGGRAVFAAVAGAYTVAVRFYTPYPDGAVLAVLFANATAPWLDWRLGGSRLESPEGGRGRH